jgi:hypothetical protein
MKRALTSLLLAGAVTGAAALPSTAAAELPQEMGYELVSPLASGGMDFTKTWLLPDGDRALIGTELSDINAVYPAHRTDDGWVTSRRSLTPPNGTPLVATSTAGVSEDGSRIVVAAVRSDFNGAPEQVIDRLAVGLADGSWRLVGGGLQYVAGNPGLDRLVVQAWWGQSDAERYPDLPGRETGVYIWEDDGTQNGTVTAIGTDAQRVVACGASSPDAAGERTLEQTGVSPDTSTVVMTTRDGCTDPDDGTPLPSHVFRWHDGVTTDLTVPASGSDQASSYVGSTPDQSSVFVRTDAALDGADANGRADLYRWDASTGARTRLTGAVTDGGDERLETAVTSNDGSRVWFSTIAADDTESLWVAARGEAPRRIATARAPADPPSKAFDLRGDSSGSNSTGFPAQTTPDGATLVFTTRTVIDGQGGGGARSSNDPGAVFRATADGELECVSCFADGSPADSPSFGGRIDGLRGMNRVVSDDGRWIAFGTESALEPDDQNDLSDVYVWHDGALFLLSAGEEGIRADFGNVSAGGDVMFKTYAQLLPWIDDDHLKVYVARVGGGGLPGPVDPREGCVGDDCQGGPLPRDPGAGNPTEGFTGPGDEDDPAAPFSANPSMTAPSLSKAAKRKLARGRAVTVTVRSNSAGRVTATTRFKVGRRWLRSSAATRTLKRAGTVRLTVRLSPKARAQLARRGAVRLRIDVVHRQVAKPRRLAFVLRSAR